MWWRVEWRDTDVLHNIFMWVERAVYNFVLYLQQTFIQYVWFKAGLDKPSRETRDCTNYTEQLQGYKQTKEHRQSRNKRLRKNPDHDELEALENFSER